MDDEWIQPVRVMLCLLVFAALAAFNLGIAGRQMPPTGDEPHYLITAHSLALDHDLSLQNNYLQKQYRAFYPGELAKRTTPSADGKRELPAEGLGLSFLLAPVYRLALVILPHSWFVSALRIFMCSITSIVLYLLLRLPCGGGMLLRAGAFFCSPLLFYSGQFYPEMPAALLLAASLLSLASMEEHSWDALLLLGLAPGALVWLHPKYLALAAALLIVAAVQFYRTFRIYPGAMKYLRPLLAGALGLAGVLSFFVFLHQQYGGWSPNRIYAGWEPEQQKTLAELIVQEGFSRVTVMGRMFFGFWIDQRFGLLLFAPFYAASIATLVWMLRSRLPYAGSTAFLFGVHFLSLCWGAPLGGFAPPSRHMVVLLPLLLFPIFTASGFWTRVQRAVFYGLMALSFGIAALMATNYRALFSNLTWRDPDSASPFWQLLHLDSILPSLTATTLPILPILLWIILFGVLSWFLYPRGQAPGEGLTTETR